jgi:heme-degrading monooxygenase HmoA
MSVLVIAKIAGDTAKFRQSLTDRAAEYEKISADARAKGGIHHRFGLGDGYVLIVDEWETADQFAQFFSAPELQAFVASVGGDTSSPPDVTVSEAVASSGDF